MSVPMSENGWRVRGGQTYIRAMDDPRYAALAARDPRFDGVFFVGVTSTGIYCRPVCPARTPAEAKCRFFDSAAAAESARFRPCLRCRPELAPGAAPVDDAHRIAGLLLQRLDESDDANLDGIAAGFEISARQLRRIVKAELGVTPIALIQTRRLLLAKQLLTDTALPVTEIAHASGFSSLRRFNAAFAERYGMPPSRLRRATPPADGVTLNLAYRPPYDWPTLIGYFQSHAIAGVESVTPDAYARTARLGAHAGWLRVSHDPAHSALRLEVSPGLVPALPAVLGRVRALFDLSARPDLIAARLAADPRLAPLLGAKPGLRIPGAFDGFEVALRTLLGQQVTVRAGSTIAARFAARFGAEIETPLPGLDRLTPTPERIAAADVDETAGLGLPAARARAVLALARAVADGLRLEPGAPPEPVMRRLLALPGIGPWSAHYIALRALRWPDAFPAGDLVLRQRLGGIDAKTAEALAESWRPWRGYAVMHLWRHTTDEASQ